ncbi:MAG: quinone oxidoreductase family protein [Burkholderiaceae bacterium]
MQAIVLSAYGSAENFRLADLPIPPLRKGDVRIRVKSISFNPIDYQIRQSLPESSQVTSSILGLYLSGVIDAVHEDVADFHPGDEVYSYVSKLASSGTYAEYVSVPAELVAKKPLVLTHDQAAAVPVVGITASLALEKVNADASRSVFIAGGAGGVGSFAIVLGQHLGIRHLITTAGNATSRAYLIEKGDLKDAQIVSYTDDDFITQAINRNGEPFDCVLDFVGGAMLSACCQLLAVDGHLASVTDAPRQDDFEFLFQRNASFHAVGAHAYSLTDDRACWKKYQDMLTQFARMFDSGALRPPYVTNVGSLSIETVRQAHDLLERSAVQGKLVMSCP